MLSQRERWMRWIERQEREARENAKERLRIEDNMIQSCHAYYANEEPEIAVICIPGRANDGALFANDFFKGAQIGNAVFVGPTPRGYAWYPMPRDANNQAAALSGVPRAIEAIEAVQRAVENKYGITKEDTILAGFSAGGVMAIQTATHSDEPYAGVSCISGAILEPKDLPVPKHQTPFLLTHNRDDMCFEWYERYLPMRECLVECGYDTYTIERDKGGHIDTDDDYEQTALFMEEVCAVTPDHVPNTPARFEKVSE